MMTTETVPLPRKVASDVADELLAARDRLAGLEQQLAQATLDDIAKRPGAAVKLSALERDVTVARQKVDNLAAALRLAEGQDARAERDARARMQQSQLAAFRAHAKARHEAMIAICAAVEAAAKAYRKFQDANEKLVAAVPIGCVLPAGARDKAASYLPGLHTGAELNDGQDLLAVEFFRLSAVDGDKRVPLPGATVPHALRRQPEKITPAVDVIRTANEWVLGSIKSQIDKQQQE